MRLPGRLFAGTAVLLVITQVGCAAPNCSRPAGWRVHGAPPSLMVLRLACFGLVVALALSGCLMVPRPATSDLMRAPANPIEPLSTDEGVVVLAAGAADETLACVRKALLRTRPAPRLVPIDQFRDALSRPGVGREDMLIPWFPEPPNLEVFQQLLGNLLVRDAIARLQIRYVVAVGRLLTTDVQMNRSAGPFVVWADKPSTSSVSADIWDLREGTVVGDIGVLASGRAGGVGVAPMFAVFSVYQFPLTDTSACNALGRHLGEFLAGRKLPVTPGE